MSEAVNSLVEKLNRARSEQPPEGHALGKGDLPGRLAGCESLLAELLDYLRRVREIELDVAPGDEEEAAADPWPATRTALGGLMQGLVGESGAALHVEVEDPVDRTGGGGVLRWFEIQDAGDIPSPWAAGWNTVANCHEQTTRAGGTDLNTTDTSVLILLDTDLQVRPSLAAGDEIGCLEDVEGTMVGVVYTTKVYFKD